VFLLRQALGNPEAAAYPTPDLRLGDEEQAQGHAALARVLAQRPRAGARRGVIGVFANATGAKRLETPWWHGFLDTLEQLNTHYDLVEIVPAFGRSLLDDRYPAYFSNDLRKLAGVLSALDACVIGDCGVMHLSCAVQTPTVGLFVATDPGEWGPYGPQDRIIQAQRNDPGNTAREFSEIVQHPTSLCADKTTPSAATTWNDLSRKIECYALPR
ncbi:hypothetical protein HH299_02065, partial [Xanthomonas sp. Kuri4-2]